MDRTEFSILSSEVSASFTAASEGDVVLAFSKKAFPEVKKRFPRLKNEKHLYVLLLILIVFFFLVLPFWLGRFNFGRFD